MPGFFYAGFQKLVTFILAFKSKKINRTQMDIKGRIIKLLPLQTGTGKNGEWKKQEFIIETEGQIAKKICFSIWGEKITQFNLSENEMVTVSFDLESREFNGRWYTDVRAWKIDRPAKKQENPGQTGTTDDFLDEPSDLPAEKEMDDLPF
jgi:hypothetical protein